MAAHCARAAADACDRVSSSRIALRVCVVAGCVPPRSQGRRFVEGQNVTIEYRWAEGQYNRLPELVPGRRWWSIGAWRRRRSSPPAHRGARVIGADALRILVISQESSDGEGGDQDNEDNPNIDAHQSSPLPMVRARRYTEAKESPGQRFPGLSMN